MDEVKQIPKKVAIYIRVSTEEQVERFGIDLQKEAIDSLIDSKKNTDQPFAFAGDDYVYIDDGVSGTVEIEERPAFARLMEDVALAPEGARPFDAVAVYKIDRFARKLKILLSVTDFFEQYELEFMSVTESIDTSTAFGRAMLSIIGVIAELERDTIKDRTGAGRVIAVKLGVHMGTGAPFGYEKDDSKRLKILDEEAKVVRTIFELFTVQKKIVYEIADYLTENKYLTAEASAIKHTKHKRKAKAKTSPYNWHPENTRRMLSNVLYIGKVYCGKTKDGKPVPEEQWVLQNVPKIIDDVTFAKAQQIASQRKHGKKKAGKNHTYLLSGLLRCDYCKKDGLLKHCNGLPHGVSTNGKRVYYYQCKGKSHLYKENRCGTLPIGADAMEDYIVNLCSNMLANPLHTYKYQQSLESTRLKLKHLRREEEQLLKLLDGLPERRERLRYHHEIGIIDNHKLKDEIDDLTKKEKLNRNKLREIQSQISQSFLDEGYIKTFELFDEKYRKTLANITKNREEVYNLIHTMIDEVIIYSRPVKDGDKVAGRKRDGQAIAYRIHVKFRLPQDMLNEIGAQKAYAIEKAPITGASSSHKDVFGAR